MAFEENWANDYQSTIAGGGFLAGALSCVVASAAGAPATPFRFKVITGAGAIEYIMVRTVAGTTFSWASGADRGLEGGSAIDHAAGEVCGAPLTAGGLANGLVRQLLAGTNMTLSPAGGQGVVTPSVVDAPTFAGLVTGLGLRDSLGVAGRNAPVLIDSQTPTGTATITLGSNPLPTNFRTLVIEWYVRSANASANNILSLKLNNDGGPNYDYTEVFSATATTQTIAENVAQTAMRIGYVSAANDTAGYFGVGRATIIGYGSAVGNKLVFTDGLWTETNLTGAAARFFRHYNKWRTTGTPITRLDLSLNLGNFDTGSLVSLWGYP